MICSVCGNEFNEKTGRRPKKFCSDACKVKYWNSRKTVVKNLNEPTNEIKPQVKEPMNNESVDTAKIAELENEIKSLGSGRLGEMRKRFLEKQIHNLKYPK